MFQGEKREIPTLFYDTVNEAPITNCKVCERNLLELDEPYLIEKAFRKKEVIFEYALCMNCAEMLRKELSKESLSAVDDYMIDNARFQERSEELKDQEYDLDKWLDRCLVKDNSRQDQDEYQIYGMFEGDKMLQNLFPYMMCGQALEEIQELLSSETKGEMERFKDKYFTIPPELEPFFRDPKFNFVL